MGWLDKLQNTVFSIRTGDGKLWYPDTKDFETSKDFNATKFDFIDQPGSRIDRKKVSARNFPLKFWFQGDDCIDQADDFDRSANDSRAWIINHPFYGQVTGQPLSIKRNDTSYNASEITVDFWETITDNFPKQTIAIADAISTRTYKFHTVSATDYGTKVDLKPADIAQIADNTNRITAAINKALNAVDYQQFQLTKNAALYGLTNMILYPTEGIQLLQNVVLAPSMFFGTLKYNANLINSIFGEILGLVTLNPTRNNKLYFENMAGGAIASLATLFINPPDGSYVTRSDVKAAADALTKLYSLYLSKLDAFYISSSNPLVAYSASAATSSALSELVIKAISGLSVIAFSAKQERIVYTEKDNNLIVLTHRYMGLDAADANIETFRTINNIRNNKLFLVPKGTKLTYYV